MEIAKELKKRAGLVSVLYAEDDKKIQEQVVQFLVKFFPSLTVCDDGQAALEKFEENPCDLLITDIKMPHLDGMSLAKKIKQRNKKSKVVITSAFDDKSLLIRSIGLHVDYYLVKPIDYESLLLILFRVVNEILIERKMETIQRHQQEVLDFQNTLILTINAHKITSANQTFLHFFNLEDFETLQKAAASLPDYFVNEPPYFYPKDKNNWIHEFYGMGDNEFLVKTSGGQHADAKVFMGRIGTLHTFDERIISLSEISGNLGLSGEKSETVTFFTPQTINRFFDLLGSELQRSKKYRLPLCVTGLRFVPPKENPVSVEAVAALLRPHLGVSDFFAVISQNKLLIVHTDQSLLELRSRIYTIREQIQKELGALSFFGMTQAGTQDTVESLLKWVEKNLSLTEEKGSSAIRTHPDVDILAQDGQRLVEGKIKKIIADKTFSLVHFYKGMKIERPTENPYPATRNTLAFPVSKEMLKTLHVGGSVYLGDTLKDLYIQATVTALNPERQEATVGEFHHTPHLPTKRQKLRVEFEDRTPVFLITEEKEAHGQMIDLSYDSMAVTLSDITGFFPGDMIRISTRFDTEKLETVAEVYRIEREGNHYRMALLLFVDESAKKQIHAILARRELQIAQEIRNFSR
jgi:DNA-binding response OmpR family regulator